MAKAPTVFPIIPADGVEFELTIEATDPMKMVRSDGYIPTGWKFTGSKVVPQTRRFKLVRVGFCSNIDEVREKLKERGSVPEGQWREAFVKAFPQFDSHGPIGFADPSWVCPRGFTGFPVLRGRGKAWFSKFHLDWPRSHREYWRWLVEVAK